MAAKKDTSKKSTSTLDTLKNFFENVTENVKEGATLVTEKIKDNSAKVYVASAELVEEANEKIHQYSDKVSLQKEQKRIEARQTEIVSEFGAITLSHYIKSGNLHKAFLTNKSVEDVVNEYKSNEKVLIAIEKKIKKLN
ncbi:hypothetical protein [uncultured Flavobacterium sp.]|uniref:hypothetical protein n=1 Tax=uncultured Flavobacterium sp. TaxID=165435 RepID=UPI0030EECAC2|tara:strand:- start:101968 stop:102384 length:417 start_codon:yes stop_codon:yes gene_type:complete